MSLVGYDAKTVRSRLTPWDHSIAGALSGAVTRFFCQPLDVAKIRLQIQVESGPASKYRGPFHLVLTMLREEGVKSLWKGHVPAQALSITYGLSSFLSFETMTKVLFNSGLFWPQDSRFRPLSHFICGSFGGCVGTLISYPFDVVRTRLVAQPEGAKTYLSMADAVAKLRMEGGLAAFYKGFVPSVIAIAPQTGLQFGFYSLFNQLLDVLVTSHDEQLGERRMTMLGSISCGGLAGLCAKAAIYPLDTTKKRLQISGWQEGRKGLGSTLLYKGALHCLSDTLKREGIRGLYKGISPALFKSVITTSLHFWLYEHFCHVLAVRRNSRSAS